jgi:cytochrome c oxidase subunit 2
MFRNIVIRGTGSAVPARHRPGRPGFRPARLVAGVLLAVGLLAAAGCGGNGQSTLSPDSRASHAISALWWTMLSGSVVVFGVVLVLLLAATLRRRGDDAPPAWALRLGEPFVLVSGIAVPALVLVGLFVLTLVVLPKTSPAASPASGAAGGREGLEIVVTGRQWFWDVDYPAQHVRTANEIHVPVGRTVTLKVQTGDVIHSLWIPELNRKIDMIPGQTNSVRVRAQQAGVFRAQCAEFCGLQHAHMALYVVAEPSDRFRDWLARESQPASLPRTAQQERGQQVFLGSACVYCHTIAGTNASGQVGPDLTHIASRLSLAAATIPNTTGYLAGWILDPQHVKPGNRMPATDLTGDQLQDLLAYLETLR